MKTTNIAKRKNQYAESTVILLHGFPTNPTSWSKVAQKLTAEGYEVLVPEQRGYSEGLRPKKRRDYKLSMLVGDIIKLMDDKGIKQAHIVGHDWGALVAWALASWYPERVFTLTAVSAPHPRALMRSLLFGKQIALSWYMFFYQLPKLPEYMLSMQDGKMLQKTFEQSGLAKPTAEKYVEYMLQPGRMKSAINWYRAMPYALREMKTFSPITVPTLFVHGGKDDFLADGAVKLTKQWVNSRYEDKFLPNATHWIPEESPDMLAELIEKHILG